MNGLEGANLLQSPLVKELIICEVCKKTFDDARLLPCQHTFCMRCIESVYNLRQADSHFRLGSIKCPTCFTIVAIPLGGISDFPVDLKVEKVRELVDEMMMKSILQKSLNRDCASDSRSSSSSSVSSHENLTGSRGFDHTSRFDNPNSRPSSRNFDLIHSRNETPILYDHVNNIRGSKEDIYGSHQSMYSSNTSINVPKATMETQTDISWEDLTTIAKDACSTPNTSTPRKMRRRRPPLPDFTTDSSKPKQNGATTNGAHNGHVKSTMSDIEESHEEQASGNYVVENNSEDVVNETWEVVDEHGDVVKDTCDMNESSDVENQSENLMNKNGEELNELNAVNKDGDVNENNDSEEQASEPKEVLYQPELLYEIVGFDYNMPTNMGFFSNGGIVVAEYGNSHLQMFEADGQFVTSYDDVKPFSLYVDNDDRVLVGDRRDRTLKIFDQQGVLVSEWEHDIFKWISGISMTNDGKYVICEREKCKVGIYEPDGILIKEFGSSGHNDTQMEMADFLTVDSHNRIIVCDSSNHCLKAFSTEGKFLAKFGHRGNGDGELEWPKGVCVDDMDNLLVTDVRNKRVTMFSPHGEFMNHLIVNYPNPHGIAFSAGEPNLIGLTRYSLKGQSMVSVFKAKPD